MYKMYFPSSPPILPSHFCMQSPKQIWPAIIRPIFFTQCFAISDNSHCNSLKHVWRSTSGLHMLELWFSPSGIHHPWTQQTEAHFQKFIDTASPSTRVTFPKEFAAPLHSLSGPSSVPRGKQKVIGNFYHPTILFTWLISMRGSDGQKGIELPLSGATISMGEGCELFIFWNNYNSQTN